MKTVSALYDEITDARNALEELIDAGFRREHISLVANDAEEAYAAALNEEKSTEDKLSDAGIGALLGGIGGMVVGLVALAATGIGAVVAAGPVVTALVGAGVGAAAGGIVAALADLGVAQSDAEYYAEGIRRGSTLLVVQSEEDLVDRAIEVLDRHQPVDLAERASEWRQHGWKGFDSTLRPYGSDELGQTRARLGS